MAKGSEDIVRNKRKGSFTTIVNEIFDTTDLDHYEKLIYMVLLRFANQKTEQCFPSYKKIAMGASCSEKTVERTIVKLIEKGFIEKQQRFYDNGSLKSNLYTILDLPDTVQSMSEKARNTVGSSVGNSVSQSLGVATHSRQGIDSLSPGIGTVSRQSGDSQSVEQYVSEQDKGNKKEENNTYYNQEKSDGSCGGKRDNVVSLFSEEIAISDAVIVTSKHNTEDVLRTYQNEIGFFSPLAAEMFFDAIDIYGPDWVYAAIVEAVKQNHRKMSYVDGILKRWKKDGFGNRDGGGSTNSGRGRTNTKQRTSGYIRQNTAAVDWENEPNSL